VRPVRLGKGHPEARAAAMRDEQLGKARFGIERHDLSSDWEQGLDMGAVIFEKSAIELDLVFK
jgi:hypothetical protein